MKKTVSVLLILCMIFSCTFVFAEDIQVEVEESIFYYEDFQYKIIDNEIYLISCDSECEGAVDIPEKINGVPVSYIGDWCFSECGKITAVKLPDTIKRIGYSAFYSCLLLEEIEIPKNVEFIGYDTFLACGELKSIKVAKENEHYTSKDGILLTKDGYEIVAYPFGLAKERAVIPDGVKKIGNVLFMENGLIKEIVLPDTVEEIGEGAFFLCLGLEKINLPEGLKKIGQIAFFENINLKSVYLPKTLEEIGQGNFDLCDNLTVYVVRDSTAHKLVESTGVLKYEFVKGANDVPKREHSTGGSAGGGGDVKPPVKIEIEDMTVNPFSDVSGNDWYFDSVMYVFENGLFSGVSESTFEPETAMTRAMFVTVLGRLDGEAKVKGSAEFTDVEKDAWYTNYVLWAAENGLVEGYGEGIFGVNDPITREQMCAILVRYSLYKDVSLKKTREYVEFTDEKEISSWASASVRDAYCAGIINGSENGMFNAGNTATRAEVAAVVERFSKNFR